MSLASPPWSPPSRPSSFGTAPPLARPIGSPPAHCSSPLHSPRGGATATPAPPGNYATPVKGGPHATTDDAATTGDAGMPSYMGSTRRSRSAFNSATSANVRAMRDEVTIDRTSFLKLQGTVDRLTRALRTFQLEQRQAKAAARAAAEAAGTYEEVEEEQTEEQAEEEEEEAVDDEEDTALESEHVSSWSAESAPAEAHLACELIQSAWRGWSCRKEIRRQRPALLRERRLRDVEKALALEQWRTHAQEKALRFLWDEVAALRLTTTTLQQQAVDQAAAQLRAQQPAEPVPAPAAPVAVVVTADPSPASPSSAAVPSPTSVPTLTSEPAPRASGGSLLSTMNEAEFADLLRAQLRQVLQEATGLVSPSKELPPPTQATSTHTEPTTTSSPVKQRPQPTPATHDDGRGQQPTLETQLPIEVAQQTSTPEPQPDSSLEKQRILEREQMLAQQEQLVAELRRQVLEPVEQLVPRSASPSLSDFSESDFDLQSTNPSASVSRSTTPLRSRSPTARSRSPSRGSPHLSWVEESSVADDDLALVEDHSDITHDLTSAMPVGPPKAVIDFYYSDSDDDVAPEASLTEADTAPVESASQPTADDGTELASSELSDTETQEQLPSDAVAASASSIVEANASEDDDHDSQLFPDGPDLDELEMEFVSLPAPTTAAEPEVSVSISALAGSPSLSLGPSPTPSLAASVSVSRAHSPTPAVPGSMSTSRAHSPTPALPGTRSVSHVSRAPSPISSLLDSAVRSRAYSHSLELQDDPNDSPLHTAASVEAAAAEVAAEQEYQQAELEYQAELQAAADAAEQGRQLEEENEEAAQENADEEDYADESAEVAPDDEETLAPGPGLSLMMTEVLEPTPMRFSQLCVDVIRARDLSDLSSAEGDDADATAVVLPNPYAVLVFQTCRGETEAAESTVAPSWTTSFCFDIDSQLLAEADEAEDPEITNNHLAITICSRSAQELAEEEEEEEEAAETDDLLLGSVVIPISDLTAQRQVTGWHSLHGRVGATDRRATGSVQLSLLWLHDLSSLVTSVASLDEAALSKLFGPVDFAKMLVRVEDATALTFDPPQADDYAHDDVHSDLRVTLTFQDQPVTSVEGLFLENDETNEDAASRDVRFDWFQAWDVDEQEAATSPPSLLMDVHRTEGEEDVLVATCSVPCDRFVDQRTRTLRCVLQHPEHGTPVGELRLEVLWLHNLPKFILDERSRALPQTP